MKKCIFIYTLICVMLFSLEGCQNFEDKDELVQNNILLVSESHIISPDEAKAIATDFLNDLGPTRSSLSVDIDGIYAWKNKDINTLTRSSSSNNLTDTLLYIVNLQSNSGYILVAADERCEEVIAFVESGHLEPTSNVDSPEMKMFLKRAGNYINSVISTNPVMPRDTIPFANGPLKLLIPLMKTSWHQFSPFNDQCPLDNGIRSMAGCAPIATAQVVAYHRSPASYNNYIFQWDSIASTRRPITEIGKTGAAYLVHQIGELENASYSALGTGVFTNDICTALTSLGYIYSHRQYEYSICRQSIEAKRPVIVIGYDNEANGGHAWVIDDYFDRIQTVINQLADGETFITYVIKGRYVHCNWGWDDNSNGYFLSGVFDTQKKVYEENSHYGGLEQGDHFYDLSSELEMFSNIHPAN